MGFPEGLHRIPEDTTGFPKDCQGISKRFHAILEDSHMIPKGSHRLANVAIAKLCRNMMNKSSNKYYCKIKQVFYVLKHFQLFKYIFYINVDVNVGDNVSVRFQKVPTGWQKSQLPSYVEK